MAKYIELTQNKYAIVDDDDFDYLNQFKWCFSQGYAYRRTTPPNGEAKTIMMHREIFKGQEDKLIDHINRNGCDNRKENLRFCTHSQNSANKPAMKMNSSGFKGVSYLKRENAFLSMIAFNRKSYILGRFKTAEEASAAYIMKSKELYGEFTNTNLFHEDNVEEIRPTEEQKTKRRVANVNNSTGYLGVSFSKQLGKYIAYIDFNKQRKYLGSFKKSADAAKSYNAAALNLFGEKAKLNTIDYTKKDIIVQKRTLFKNNTSGYRGVSFNKTQNKYVALFREKCLGYFDDILDAAEAYNKKAFEILGDDALLNSIDKNRIKKVIPQSRRLTKSNTTGYRGVSFNKATSKFVAMISLKGKSIYLGRFDDAKSAAKAYNDAAINYHGSKAVLNIIPE